MSDPRNAGNLGVGPPGSGAGRRIRAGLALLALGEVIVAILIGRWIGAAATVLALLAISVAGIWVLRLLGRRVVRSVGPVGRAGPVGTGQQGQDAGEIATIAAGGLLLAVPGFLTGLAGLLLVVPPTRALLRPAVRRLTGSATARLLRMSGLERVVPGEVVTPADVHVEVIEVRDAAPGSGPGRPGDAPPSLPGPPGPASRRDDDPEGPQRG